MKTRIIILTALSCLLLSACAAKATPNSSDVSDAAATIAGQTLTAMFTPAEATDTPIPTQVPTQIPSAVASSTESTPAKSDLNGTPNPGNPGDPTATADAFTTPIVVTTQATTGKIGSKGCYGAKFINDASIPDGTEITMEHLFEKSWVIKNTGTCDWDSNFHLRLYSGDRMSGSDYTFTKPVKAGQTTTVTIRMYAPNQQGTYTGTWSMTYGSAGFFGEFVTVKIVAK